MCLTQRSDPSTGAGLTETEPGGEHDIKGKFERQRVFRLLRLRKGASRSGCGPQPRAHGLCRTVSGARNVGPLLGRERRGSANRRTSSVNPASASPGCYMSFAADSVIGRYSCWRELLADGQQTPFRPFIEVVRGVVSSQNRRAESDVFGTGQGPEILAWRRNKFGTAAQFAGTQPPPGNTEGLGRQLIGLGTRDLLLSFARTLPDHPRHHAARKICTGLTRYQRNCSIGYSSDEILPLLVVHTRRPEYQPPWNNHRAVEVLRLAPLSVSETSEIIRARLQLADLPERWLARSAIKAEGNPLFAGGNCDLPFGARWRPADDERDRLRPGSCCDGASRYDPSALTLA